MLICFLAITSSSAFWAWAGAPSSSGSRAARARLRLAELEQTPGCKRWEAGDGALRHGGQHSGTGRDGAGGWGQVGRGDQRPANDSGPARDHDWALRRAGAEALGRVAGGRCAFRRAGALRNGASGAFVAASWPRCWAAWPACASRHFRAIARCCGAVGDSVQPEAVGVCPCLMQLTRLGAASRSTLN